MSEPQQLSQPDPRGQVVSAAALKYLRAGQIIADAAYALYNRLAPRGVMQDQAAAAAIAAVPGITEAVLADLDIMEPQAED